MKPPAKVAEQTVRYWISKHRVAVGSLTMGSVDELEAQYGSVIRRFADAQGIGYKLMKALESHNLPVKITR